MQFVPTTTEAAAAARIGARTGAQNRRELLWLLRPCLAWTGPWVQAGKYVSALISGLPGPNGWTIAERAADRAPDKTQRLLSRAVWDTSEAMGVVRRFAVAPAMRTGGNVRASRQGIVDARGVGPSGGYRSRYVVESPGQSARVPPICCDQGPWSPGWALVGTCLRWRAQLDGGLGADRGAGLG